jgi:alkylation response protein AidB-like acyl-CoA dehydrogenase
MEQPGSVAGSALVEHARRLVPLLHEHARAIEDARRLTPAVHAAFVEAGFYRMTMPAEFGAPARSLAECMRTLEILASGDGSAAWSVWASLGVPAMSAFLPEAGAGEMFTAIDACAVGSMAGMGRAVAVEGGYRVTGHWRFVSGIHQATFAGGMSFVFDGETQRMGANGPVVVLAVWPVAQCAMVDTWDTTGLRGTGSDDMTVEDLFVPAHRIADFSRPPRPGLGPVHYMRPENGANVTVAALALGIATAGLEEFRAFAPKRKLGNGEILAESALGKLALTEAESGLAETRGRLYETAELMDEELTTGTYDDETWLPRTHVASVRAVDAAIAATSRLYREAGTSAIFRSGVLDRCLRDLLTLGAHKSVQHANLLVYGGATFDPPQV